MNSTFFKDINQVNFRQNKSGEIIQTTQVVRPVSGPDGLPTEYQMTKIVYKNQQNKLKQNNSKKRTVPFFIEDEGFHNIGNRRPGYKKLFVDPVSEDVIAAERKELLLRYKW